MIESNWPERFFDDGYEETFRRLGKYGTTQEDVANLLSLVPLRSGARILDVPCGWGRHAGQLAVLGFDVVGVDGSAAQIRRARELWPTGVFYESDMREIPESNFDAVLNLWTSFGSMESQENDFEALESWFSATSPGGFLVMELTTREYAEAINRTAGEEVGRKSVTICGVREDAIFDWKDGISYNTYTRDNWSRTCVTRLYERSQLEVMLKAAGYGAVCMYGSFAGHPIGNDRRTVIVGRK